MQINMSLSFNQEKTMKIASIDIGTNTILLLIAEIVNGDLIAIREEFRIPRIGKDLKFKHIISKDSINSLIKILQDYLEICKEFDVSKVICGGTAPFRIAKNSYDVIDEVLKQTGLKIKILTQTEEAILTFLGGISNFNEFFGNKNIIVIDIGGGSTEITYGNIDEIFFLKSYEIGAVTLKDIFFSEFPYNHDNHTIHTYLQEIFIDAFEFENFIVIGVAGTPTTIASIYLNQSRFNEKEVDKTYITKKFLNDLIKRLYVLSPQQILIKFPSVVNGREDVILPGTIILEFLLSRLKAEGFYVSTRGIRYGLIIQELFENTDWFWTKVGLKKFLSSLKG